MRVDLTRNVCFKPMTSEKKTLDGITLEFMLTELVAELGWETMAQHINIRCFTSDPSIPSSLKFLRRTPWARTRVEDLYLNRKIL